MILGTGIDIVEVGRIAGLIERYGERFLKRIFSEEEIAYSQSHSNPALHYAARFAAKEACVKALAGISLTAVKVATGKRGKPFIREIPGIDAGVNLQLSLSHTHRYAVAVVIAEKDEERCGDFQQ